MFEGILIVGLLVVGFLAGYLYKENKELKEKEDELDKRCVEALKQAELQLEANRKILSQKKSSEVTTGLILEQAAPFLEEFKFNPRDAAW